MKTVRLHVDGSGTLWLLAKCRRCGQVHKYLAATVAKEETRCKSCAAVMQMEGAVVDPHVGEEDARSPPA